MMESQSSSNNSKNTTNFMDNEPDYILAREEMVGNIRVIVPDIEAEFKFLFDSQLPHHDKERVQADCQPTYRHKNVDFLGSYVQFLEDGGDNVERLKASHANVMKRWFGNDTGDGETSASTSPAREESKSMTEEEGHDLLPKTSTSDEDDDEITRTALLPSAKSILNSSKEDDRVGCRNYEHQEIQSKEAGTVGKEKRNRDWEKRLKSEWRRMSNEVELSEQLGRETPEYLGAEVQNKMLWDIIPKHEEMQTSELKVIPKYLLNDNHPPSLSTTCTPSNVRNSSMTESFASMMDEDPSKKWSIQSPASLFSPMELPKKTIAAIVEFDNQLDPSHKSFNSDLRNQFVSAVWKFNPSREGGNTALYHLWEAIMTPPRKFSDSSPTNDFRILWIQTLQIFDIVADATRVWPEEFLPVIRPNNVLRIKKEKIQAAWLNKTHSSRIAQITRAWLKANRAALNRDRIKCSLHKPETKKNKKRVESINLAPGDASDASS